MKLSAYTIAKNCTDLNDLHAGYEELRYYFRICDKQNKKPTQTSLIRFSNICDKIRELGGVVLHNN